MTPTFLYTLVLVSTLSNGEQVTTENPVGAATQQMCEDAARVVRSEQPGTIAYCRISGEVR